MESEIPMLAPIGTRFQAAIWEARLITGFPIPMCVGSALSAASAAVQGRIKVAIPSGMVFPVSLHVVHISNNKDQKNYLDEIFAQGFLHEITAPIDNADVALLKQLMKKDRENFYAINNFGEAVLKSKSPEVFNFLNSTLNGEFYSKNHPGNKLTKHSKKALTLSLLIGDRFFDEVRRKEGLLFRKTGYFSRCIVLEAFAMHGMSYPTNDPNRKININWFNDQARKFVNMSNIYNEGSRVLLMSGEARLIWDEFRKKFIQTARWIENQGGDARFAKEMHIIAAKIAAIVNFFESENSDFISRESMNFSLSLCNILMGWYCVKFFQIKEEKFPEKYAISLRDFFQRKLQTHGIISYKLSKLRQIAPYACRKKSNFDAAISVLLEKGLVCYQKEEKSIIYTPRILGFPQTLEKSPPMKYDNSLWGNIFNDNLCNPYGKPTLKYPDHVDWIDWKSRFYFDKLGLRDKYKM